MSIIDYDDHYIKRMSEIVGEYEEFIRLCHMQQHATIGVPWMVLSHGNILLSLLVSGELTMTELTMRIHRTAPTTTTLVKKLKKEGMVNSRKSKDDSRVNLISLTDRGREHCATMEEYVEKFYDVAATGITEEEAENVWRILTKSMNSIKSGM